MKETYVALAWESITALEVIKWLQQFWESTFLPFRDKLGLWLDSGASTLHTKVNEPYNVSKLHQQPLWAVLVDKKILPFYWSYPKENTVLVEKPLQWYREPPRKILWNPHNIEISYLSRGRCTVNFHSRSAAWGSDRKTEVMVPGFGDIKFNLIFGS